MYNVVSSMTTWILRSQKPYEHRQCKTQFIKEKHFQFGALNVEANYCPNADKYNLTSYFKYWCLHQSIQTHCLHSSYPWKAEVDLLGKANSPTAPPSLPHLNLRLKMQHFRWKSDSLLSQENEVGSQPSTRTPAVVSRRKLGNERFSGFLPFLFI